MIFGKKQSRYIDLTAKKEVRKVMKKNKKLRKRINKKVRAKKTTQPIVEYY